MTSKKKKEPKFATALECRCFTECIDEAIEITHSIDSRSPLTLNPHRPTKIDWLIDFEMATTKIQESSVLFNRLLAGEVIDERGMPLISLDQNLVRGVSKKLRSHGLWPVSSYYSPSGARKKQLTLILPKRAVPRTFYLKDDGSRRWDSPEGAPFLKVEVDPQPQPQE